ncbi:MAG: hypothetical protein ACPGLY_02130 [Rubripirellula sp.]
MKQISTLFVTYRQAGTVEIMAVLLSCPNRNNDENPGMMLF